MMDVAQVDDLNQEEAQNLEAVVGLLEPAQEGVLRKVDTHEHEIKASHREY